MEGLEGYRKTETETELSASNQEPPPNSRQSVVNIVYQLFRIPVEIGSTKTYALVDTGASASIISDSFFNLIPKSELRKQQESTQTFRSVCGKLLQAVNTFEIDIRIHPNDQRKIRQLFHIVTNLTESCILGIDFIINTSIKIDSTNRKITYVSDERKYHVIGKFDVIDSTTTSTKVQPKERVRIDNEDCERYREIIQNLLEKNRDIIAEKMSELGKAIGAKHSIVTKGPPIFSPPRRNARALQQVIQENIDDMLTHDIIRPSTSPYSSPIVLVPKKSGEKRFCIDYRRLNSITVKDKYPLPRIDDTIDHLHGAKFFSTLDLFSGYWQIEIEEEDKQKTAFTTDEGHFEFNRMPFGLTNAPATFQRLINNVLRQALKKYALVYLDDVIIFSKTIDDHINHIQAVLKLLKEAGLKIKLSKCTFLRQEVEYLGHIVSNEGIKPDPKKQLAIDQFPVPKNVDQVRSFLGLAGYYRKFVKNYADKAHSLTQLTRKDIEWKWGSEQQKAFQLLKDGLTSPPILSYPDFSLDFAIHTDASGYGVGSVLAQMQKDKGKEKEVVIAYASQHLNSSQANWSTVEKEAYAIVHAVKTFYPYLYGRRFQVLTDHRPLQWLMSIKEPTGRLARWALFLQEFDIEIVYRAGKLNQNADCLSRIPIDDIDQPLTKDSVPIYFVTKDFAEEQVKDSYCMSAREKFVRARERHNDTVKEDQEINSYPGQKEVILGPSEKADTYKDDSDSDDDCLEFIELNNGLIGTPDGKILVPEVLRVKILKRFHDSPYAGHLGTRKTIARIRRRYLWPKMTKDIKEYIRKCEICAKRKACRSSKAPLRPIPPPEHVWQTMAMDIVGPLTQTGEGNVYILVMGEYLTRFIITAPMQNQTADTVAKTFIKSIVLQHGVPERVLTDQGTNFLSQIMDNLYKQLGIERLRTTAYRPNCDGMIERFNRTVGDMLASYVSKQPDKWDEFLPYATFAYNTAVHASTGHTPFYLMFGREAREPNDVLPPARLLVVTDQNNIFSRMWNDAMEIAKDTLKGAQEKQKHYYDRNTKTVKYNIGDTILLKEMQNTPGKFNMRWEGPYVIKEKKNDVNYKIESADGKKILVTHVDRMKLFKQSENEPVEVKKTSVTQEHSAGNKEITESNIGEEKKKDAGKVELAIKPKKRLEARKPQQTRYTLREKINLPARLRD